MALQIGDNFSYQGQKFNFERDCFATKASMKSFLETSIPPYGFRTFCQEDKKYYEFNIDNEIDENTGKWREIVDYSLPIASSDTLGGVKVGGGLTINEETGVLSATGGGVADSVDWNNITSKPKEFKPEPHEHEISEVNGLTEQIANLVTNSDLIAELNKKVDKVEGKSLVDDTEIAKLATLENYDDTSIKKDIANLQADKANVSDTLAKTQLVQELNVEEGSENNIISQKIVSENLLKLLRKVFPLTVNVSGGGVYEKNSSNDITIQWTIKEGDDIVIPSSIKLNGEIVETSATSKTFSGVTETTIYKLEIEKDSVIASGSTTAAYYNPSYFGIVNEDFEASETNIIQLNKVIKDTKNMTKNNLNLNNQKLCYSYPKSFGELVIINDSNNLDYINSYKKSELEINSETYYCYLMIDSTTLDNFKQIYS